MESTTTTVVSIEGIPGAGKSHVIHQLKNNHSLREHPQLAGRDIHFLTEPVDLWLGITDEYGSSILEQFYRDQKRHAFGFQILALVTIAKQLREAVEAHPGAVIVTERSIHSCREVFVKSLCDAGKISSTERQIYEVTFDELTRTLDGVCSQTVVYLKTDVPTCLARIKERGREGEGKIGAVYLNECDRCHERFFQACTLRKQKCVGEFDAESVAAAIETLLAIP